MAPSLKQSAANAVGRYQSRTCQVTLDTPSTANNLLVVMASCSTWDYVTNLTMNTAGFTLIRERQQGSVKLAVWYQEGAPALSTISVTVSNEQSLQVRVFEYSGVRQSGALDKVVIQSASTAYCDTGSTGSTAQADSVVVSAVANLYESATQYGFTGGLARLYELVTPPGYDADHDRCRMTVHHLIANVISSFRLQCYLSTWREWVAIICTFRGGSSGPARFSSTTAPPMLQFTGSGNFTSFGPLKSTTAPAALAFAGSGDMYPFDYQYRLNWGSGSRLLIGADTPFDILAIEGLEGSTARTSDDDLPRSDGAIRGIDLQAARQIVVKLKVVTPTATDLVTQRDVEERLRQLYLALVSRRDTDWELVWRHPGRPVRMLRCRPTELVRVFDKEQTFLQEQTFALRAADPRHYSPVAKTVSVPVTPVGSNPTPVAAVNVGNAPAYPLIRIQGPPSGAAVNRIELVNATAGVTFDVLTTIPAKSLLVGDMEARVTSAPRSVITLDGQTKYGAWQFPREPFFIAPTPDAPDGSNLIYLITDPPGAAVAATLEYRDTWSS